LFSEFFLNCAGQKDVEQILLGVSANEMKQSSPWRGGDCFAEKHWLAKTGVQGVFVHYSIFLNW
jgi:hypothetical protein